MSHRLSTALSILAASLLALFSGLAASGCGEDADGGNTAIPEWALELPEGARYGAWSPDGKLFALPARNRIELIDTAGNTNGTVRVPGLDNSGFSCNCHLGWSEDGTEIHAVTRPTTKAPGGIVTVDVGDGSLGKRPLNNLHIADAAWAPQGWPVVLAPGDFIHQAGEQPPKTYPLLRLNGIDGRLDLLFRRRREITELAFSPDGSRIVFTILPERGSESLWTATLDGGKPRLLLSHLLRVDAAWSPNGRELAVNTVFFSKRPGKRHLFLISAATGKRRPLTKRMVAEGVPAWTPDGRWIAYAGEDGSVNKIRRDGTRRQRLFELPGEEVAALNWSRDGRHLVFTSKPISLG